MVEVGDLVVLDASASNADAFVWMLAGGSTKQFAVSKDGTMIYFAAKNPGQYIFHAALAKNMASGKPPALTMVEKVVVVHAVTPPPGPTPTPGPSPAPSPTPLPAGKFDLANFTRTTVFSNVPSEKRGACVAFAGNYSSVAAQIQSGSIKTLADAIAKLKTLNQGSSGADKDFWATNVFAPLSTKLNAMTSAGTLKTSALADWQEAFVEIGAGFAASSN
ncbi:MAG TPA: hypothetical protein VGR71_13465, partial [Nitrospira sp.]|nr:hypothetical protein [Nitrospira sp.]